MIQVQHIGKRFGHIHAVKDLSFTVKKGEILGFLGPNAAGKSTTMRIITGFIPPSEGSVYVGGYNVAVDTISVNAITGYLPENAPVYPDMSVAEYLSFCSAARGFTGAEKKNRVKKTLSRCFLQKVRYQPIRTLSKGYRQRVCFAQSIIHDPEYLILDEPTDGLDPNQKHEMRQLIKKMSRNKAIILSTHVLEEMEAVCTRAIIIADGKKVIDDTPENLKQLSPSHGAVTLEVLCDDAVADMLLADIQQISSVRSAEIVETRAPDMKRMAILPTSPNAIAPNAIDAAIRDKDCRLHAMFITQGRLDTVFRNLTAKEPVLA